MDMELLREWLVQNGVSAAELDKVDEPRALQTLGETLKTTLENDNQLGLLVSSTFMQFNAVAEMVMQQQLTIMQLQADIEKLKGEK